MRPSIGGLLAQDSPRLAAALGLDAGSARIETQILLRQALKISRATLLAHPERILSPRETDVYDALFERRLAGEPVAYILGEREFYGLPIKVTPATLIPRPETELLVELALARMDKSASQRLLDLGTGSGAIALAIAQQRPGAFVLACDASEAALAVAQENARRLALPNVGFTQSDWFTALEGRRFNLIVSNPPYVAEGDPHLMQGDLRFEPAAALSSGPDGFDDIRRIVSGAAEFLDPHGWLLLEHGYDQGDEVRKLLRQAGFENVFSARDLAGIERASGGQAGIQPGPA